MGSAEITWDEYFMLFAKIASAKSHCFSRKVGAAIVKDRHVLATGYNGPAKGVPHCDTRNPNREQECPRRLQGFQSGQGLHLCRAGHAEVNAIAAAAAQGVSIKESAIYIWTADDILPCKECSSTIINAQIGEVFVCNAREYSTMDHCVKSSDILDEAEMTISALPNFNRKFNFNI